MSAEIARCGGPKDKGGLTVTNYEVMKNASIEEMARAMAALAVGVMGAPEIFSDAYRELLDFLKQEAATGEK